MAEASTFGDGAVLDIPDSRRVVGEPWSGAIAEGVDQALAYGAH